MKSRERRLIPFPAFSYAFTQRGSNHTRAFTTWVLLQKTLLFNLRQRMVVRMICRRMGLSAKQARVIIRHGEGRFWTTVSGTIYPHSSKEVAGLVSWLRLTRYVKRSKIFVPEQALRNLGQLRAHLSLPVITRSDVEPTARAYTAVCLGRTKNTVSIYRRWLREAGFIKTQANYLRLAAEGGTWRRGQFISSNGAWMFQRLPDFVLAAGANIYRVNKGQRPFRGIDTYSFGDLRYRESALSIPVVLPPAHPPSPPPTETEIWIQNLRQETHVRAPQLKALLPRV